MLTADAPAGARDDRGPVLELVQASPPDLTADDLAAGHKIPLSALGGERMTSVYILASRIPYSGSLRQGVPGWATLAGRSGGCAAQAWKAHLMYEDQIKDNAASMPCDTPEPESEQAEQYARAALAIPLQVRQRSRIVDEVVYRLRESILSHSIEPGARLVQAELASRMGVSRTPLREALRVMEQDGLVRVSDGNRTVEVARLSRRDLIDLYAIREVLDGLAARTMADRGSDHETQAMLAEFVGAMEPAGGPFPGHEYFSAHIKFHATIMERCGNRRLASQLPLVRMTAASLRDSFPKFVTENSRTSAAAARETAQATHKEHLRIYEAIVRTDPQTAERAARAHIANAVRYFPAD
jgi:GntR family transcriptional regulator of vanillate catabolism